MINGRVKAGAHDLGSGFCLADRIVATAAHVVRDCVAADLAFVTAGGVSLPVVDVQADPAIDVAVLHLRDSLATVPPLAHAKREATWLVTGQPQTGDSQLSGSITATNHLVTNEGGHQVEVLQLNVTEMLKDYHGYSGSAVIVGNAVVGILVEQVPERAEQSAALRRHAANVLYAVPVDEAVRRFGLDVKVYPSGEPLLPHQLLDTANFDLDSLKTDILAAKSKADGRILAFGVNGDEIKVVTNLFAWLPSYIGETATKGQLSLKAALISVDAAAKYLTRYVANLQHMNVMCQVLVDGVPAELVADLLKRVRATPGQPQKWLVLFLVGTPVGGFPPDVTVLPQPSFDRRDITAWTAHVAASAPWPNSLATVWSDHIIAEASTDDELDIRITYEVLEAFIDRLRAEPDEVKTFLKNLELRC